MMTRAGGARTRTTKVHVRAQTETLFSHACIQFAIQRKKQSTIRDDAKCILRARLGGTYSLSMTSHLVVTL